MNHISTISCAICTDHAVAAVNTLSHQVQRFDSTKLPLTQLQHIGTAAAVLIAEVALKEDSKERAEHLQSLRFLAELADQTSPIYWSAEMISNTLKDVFKVDWALKHPRDCECTAGAKGTPTEPKSKNGEHSVDLENRRHRPSTASTLRDPEIPSGFPTTSSTNTHGLSITSDRLVGYSRPQFGEGLFEAPVRLDRGSGTVPMDLDSLSQWELSSLDMSESQPLGNNQLYFSDFRSDLAM